MDITPYLPYIYAILAVLAYALTSYFKNTPFEQFDKIKFSATILTSLLVAYELISNATAITEQNVLLQLSLYGFVTVLIENILNGIFRKVAASQKAQAFIARKPQGTLTPALTFTAAPRTGSAPLSVLFTDTSGGQIKSFAFGGSDGFGMWDTTGQTMMQHIYKTAGTYQVRALGAGSEMSEITEITVTGSAPTPVPVPVVKKSWLEVLWSLIKALFGL